MHLPLISLLNVTLASAGTHVVSWSDLFVYRRVAKEELVFNRSPSMELGSCLPLAIHQNKSSPAFMAIDLLRKFNVQAVSLSHSPSSSALIQSRLRVRVELLSNHGDLDFVCLYNVQVHPDLTKE
ncbi:hypothetical protein BLNAU_21086 [Blattamonas nauphoetae]|uniref:Uncharacterized protein n=1 Tax=Blattamonas nauphoetae TaxID=2049346 RepID=A0ABQ9WWV0_9EUKA|nr:hypothetical protein BLNAU_21086 [Blattamonas nauphoetae]